MQLLHGKGQGPRRSRACGVSSFAVSRALISVNVFALLGSGVLGLSQCAPHRQRASPAAIAPATAAEPDSRELSPAEQSPPPNAVDAPTLVGPVSLEVPGFRAAVVQPPADPTNPKPVLVAAHGAGDSPEWQCEVWGAIVKGRGFILCLRGLPMSPNVPVGEAGFFFRDHFALGRELSAALKALRASYGPRVDPGPVVYTGYSQGATMGALATVKQPAVFSRLVLIEGGHAEWDVRTARAYKRGGGERVLFACGQGYCARSAQNALRWLERAGLDARLEYVEGGGHTYGGKIAERLSQSFGWLVAGDGRWGGS